MQIKTFEKKTYKIFLTSEWFINFYDKNKRNNKTKNLNIILC